MNTENILDASVEVIVPKSQSLKLGLEKLEGGYISDISGKRRIYKDADEVLDGLDLHKVVTKLDHAQYHVNIQIVHNDDYQDFLDLTALHIKDKILSLEEAKTEGIVQVEKFNPLPVEPVLCNDEPIKVTMQNAYSIARLKAIDWKAWDEQLPMSVPEKATIAGLNKCSMYSLWNNMKDGKSKYQLTKTRIGATILAQYYERNLGVRSSTKDACEKMKEDTLKMIREIELIMSGKQFIKSTEVATRLVKMRSMLL